jgi:UDP-N-acetylglucosamine--N-acetylmuramyl-(pentapeptide) pyrophosphoryl-undecaprenol N-acetylglucosamine transferase
MRFVCTGGGTGGHLYPILALADFLRNTRKDSALLFIGTSRGLEAKLVPGRGYDLKLIPARPLSSHPIRTALALADLGAGIAKSLGILRTFKPDLILGSGGYVSAAVVLAGRLLGIPALLLEQNAIPGKTTRLLSRWARYVAVSFEETIAALPAGKGVFTGNPVREEIASALREEGRRRFGIPADSFCLLVTGASQGARSINEGIVEGLGRLAGREMTVIHLTGEKNFEEVRRRAVPATEGKPLRYVCLGYLDDMASAYAAADLVVCRAGATTLAEVTVRGLPSIMIPYPHAAENHQMKNALALERAGASVVIEDGSVGEKLVPAIEDLADDAEKRERMGRAAMQQARPDALRRIGDLIDEIIGADKGR